MGLTTVQRDCAACDNNNNVISRTVTLSFSQENVCFLHYPKNIFGVFILQIIFVFFTFILFSKLNGLQSQTVDRYASTGKIICSFCDLDLWPL